MAAFDGLEEGRRAQALRQKCGSCDYWANEARREQRDYIDRLEAALDALTDEIREIGNPDDYTTFVAACNALDAKEVSNGR